MTTFMSEYIPTLAAQFEVLLDQLDNVDLNALSEFDIKLIRLLSLQARDALNVAIEELNAVENKFSQMVVASLEDATDQVSIEFELPQISFESMPELTLNERLQITKLVHQLEEHANYVATTTEFSDREKVNHLLQFCLENLEILAQVKVAETKCRKWLGEMILRGAV